MIIKPQFAYKGSAEKALEIIINNFPDCKVIPFNANWIAKEGVVFNCMSWGIEE
ncbi:MAG: hypothetical protein JEZ09_07200 [Salinivirgaceae bacterium]|nr:hypothetical protein [Salinivirgaceae bacterium]